MIFFEYEPWTMEDLKAAIISGLRQIEQAKKDEPEYLNTYEKEFTYPDRIANEMFHELIMTQEPIFRKYSKIVQETEQHEGSL